ncbi:MAG: DEAD/DEAH box helicase [Chloroflexota bacterium]|nr:MAG: DEAD/DEAH box helicase [Chloroflexota bacterium]
MIRQPLVAIDCEWTTSRTGERHLIEIAAIRFLGDRVLDTFASLISPPSAISLGVRRLTGIEDRVLRDAPAIERALPRFTAYLGNTPLVGHSIGFDLDALRGAGANMVNHALDTHELASIMLPGLASYALGSVASHLGIARSTNHRALGDAQTTHRVFRALTARVKALDRSILREIVDLTRPTLWSLAPIFAAIDDEVAPTGGTTIRDAIAAKVGVGAASLDAFVARVERPPLVAQATAGPIDIESTVALARGHGPLGRAIDDFAERPQQIAMLRAVCEQFGSGGQLLVEAGTGTGKSLAYLLPAIRHSVATGERVVVSTNTINLQEQLVHKDLPRIQVALPDAFTFTALKGRQNYLCFQRWAAMRRRTDLSLSEIVTLVKVLVWLPTTESGDVSELNLLDDERQIWSRLNAASDSCTPRRCAAIGHRGCFIHYARERAAASHVTVVNHSLLLSDMAVDNKVIPDYRYLIVDEAHHLEDQATSQLGFTATLGSVAAYLDILAHTSSERRSGIINEIGHHLRGADVSNAVQSEIERVAQELSSRVENARAAAIDFFATVSAVFRTDERTGGESRVRITKATRAQSSFERIDTGWDNLAIAFAEVHTATTRLETHLQSLESSGLLEYEALMGALAGATRVNAQLRESIGGLVVGSDSNSVTWVTITPTDVSLNVAPLLVGDLLQESLFAKKAATILTSATLTTNGDFTYINRRLGIPDATTLAVGSPFDYEAAALLCLPTDIPEPDNPRYGQDLARSLIDVSIQAGGRTLILFTSHAQLRQTFFAIRARLERQNILVLGQGIDGTSRRHLTTAFATNPRTVLLGTASFWEGVDIAGDALSVLAIAKLPFPVPSDPIVSARSELFDEPFMEFSVPSAILRFKQGFGRLIRSTNDRGVVICYDRRIATKRYGELFLRSLPPASRRRLTLAELPEAVRSWIRPSLARVAVPVAGPDRD